MAFPFVHCQWSNTEICVFLYKLAPPVILFSSKCQLRSIEAFEELQRPFVRALEDQWFANSQLKVKEDRCNRAREMWVTKRQITTPAFSSWMLQEEGEFCWRNVFFRVSNNVSSNQLLSWPIYLFTVWSFRLECTSCALLPSLRWLQSWRAHNATISFERSPISICMCRRSIQSQGALCKSNYLT